MRVEIPPLISVCPFLPCCRSFLFDLFMAFLIESPEVDWMLGPWRVPTPGGAVCLVGIFNIWPMD